MKYTEFEKEVFILYDSGYNYSNIIKFLKRKGYDNVDGRVVDNAIFRLKRKIGDYYEFESRSWKR